MKAILVTLLFLSGCHTGDFEENCNPNGGCNSDKLECGWFAGKCRVKTEPQAIDKERRCSYESECFCVTCADKCGTSGVKTCAFSDTSVWGAKPAVCECK